MELKSYQKAVLTDLSRYLQLLAQTQDMSKAYELVWNEKNVRIGENGMPPYRPVIPGVPSVCLKVPTGGGKTFIAASALKPLFDAMPPLQTRAVVWLVPSDSILEQTYHALNLPSHPYRQRLDVDFSNRVEVYDKQQLLAGQNFSPSTISEQLSLFVLSYDSFRTNKREGRKAWQENAHLAPFIRQNQRAESLLAGTDASALIQVVRAMNPIVVVDESHHATSALSLEMLGNFNPSFILELTATPHRNSNIISLVNAMQLKKENMVKLPVIVYNRKTQEDVFGDAIHLRNRLEQAAEKETAATGRYIRPIVLFQAQPRTTEDSTTFGKIKKTLISCGIPEEQIAIRTSETNELRQIDLKSERCPIRYIITVNALREGWDCPFAYVLATVANRNSTVDVEQILGRVLRLPDARRNQQDVLNISYVITSSSDFQATLEKVVAGLNHAGFGRHELVADPDDQDTNRNDSGYIAFENGPHAGAASIPPHTPPQQLELETIHTQESERDNTEWTEVDPGRIKDRLDSMNQDTNTGSEPSSECATPDILEHAIQLTAAYEKDMEKTPTDLISIPAELRDKMKTYTMLAAHREEASGIRLPQFMVKTTPTIFSDGTHELLQKEHLADGFTLKDKDLHVNFTSVAAEMARVDVAEGSDTQPRAFRLSGVDNAYFKEWFASLPSAQRIHHCRQMIHGQLSRLDSVEDGELREYIDRVIDTLTQDQLAELEHSPHLFGACIKGKIHSLLTTHALSLFDLWMEQGRINSLPQYAFPDTISPTTVSKSLPKSLYEAEEAMNPYEFEVVWAMTSLDNIVWWHRNLSRTGFCINGPVHAYPDIIARTENGKILLVETKGDHLDNEESERKARIGARWANEAGRDYRYFMVFDKRNPNYPGAFSRERFMEIVRGI